MIGNCRWLPALFVAVITASFSAVHAEEKERLQILLLGDSTTIGSVCRQTDPSGPHLEDVVRLLLAAEKDLPPVNVINQGRDGEFIHGLLSGGRYDREIAKLTGVDYVFIRYGLNDNSKRQDFDANFPKDFHELIARLRKDFPKATIFPTTIIPYLTPEADERINAHIRKVAKDEKLTLFDVYTRYKAELGHGANMLNYRRYPLDKIPETQRGWVKPFVLGGSVVVMDNRLDAQFRELPGWFSDRHPNLAGYHVIGDETAKFLAKRMKAGASTTSDAVEIPKGDVTKHTFDQSRIFPGTTRDYWVYVPKQYDPAKPACVYVNQDGQQYNAPEVFDELIHRKEMPVTIGVFVMHGRLKAPSDQALDRFNRSYEYDGLGDNYARFLLEELLPEVEKLTTADGRPIRLSKDGNDRAIGGASSGAICAFTTTWERPDAFRRVFSAIGTYVGLRGGHNYPTLIRKVEPKPIRVFLQDGSADQNIYGGDWWMANQEMERALTFAGYEVRHAWGDGGHNGRHATEIFPDAMRWLWKDWPKPIAAGKGSPQLQEILAPGEEWELVAEGYKFTEGPCVNAKGELFYNDVPGSKTYKVGLDGKLAVFLENSKKGDGQRFGPGDRLVAVAGEAEQIVAYDGEGKPTTLADGFRGNDLVVRHDGNIYVTNPGWNGTDPSKVWHISKSGEKKVVDIGLKFSNGITLSPDQSLLYVADSRTHWVYSYQIQPDGSLAHKQKYFHLHVPDTADDSGADGLRTDRDGRLYVATRMGIQVCDQAGRVNCILPTPNGKVSNFDFAGPDFKTLYATCGDRVYRRKLKVQGARHFEPPVKPMNPRL